MFPEFGQAPLCLEFDLKTYDGPDYHVKSFRGREGWLMAARGTIQNEHHLLSAKLIVACDEHENLILPFKAETLASCGWKNLTESAIEPPGILDDLMCEQEGDLYARFQRMINRDLAGMEERAQRHIEVIDARIRAAERRLDRELSELRRRRLMSESPEERMALSNLMADIEADHDRATADLMAERTRQRRRADAAEEMLWEDTDALIEVEPLFTINWCASDGRTYHIIKRQLRQSYEASTGRLAHDNVATFEREKELSARLKLKDQVPSQEEEISEAATKLAPERKARAERYALPSHANAARVKAITDEFAAALAASAKKKAAEEAIVAETEVAAPKPPAFGQEFIAQLIARNRAKEAEATAPSPEPVPVKAAPEVTPPSVLEPSKPQFPKLETAALDELASLQKLKDKHERRLAALEVRLASPNMAEAIRGPLLERRNHYITSIAELDAEMDAIRAGGPRPSLNQPTPTPQLPLSNSCSKRDRLVLELAKVAEEGAKFRQGSPKFAANLAKRRELERSIAALGRQPEAPPETEEKATATTPAPEPAPQQLVVAEPPPAPAPASVPQPAHVPATAQPSLRKIWLRKKANLDARVLDLDALKASHSPWTQPWFEVQDLLKKAQDELHLINQRLGVSSIPTPVAKPVARPEAQEAEVAPSPEPTPSAVLPPLPTDPRAKLLRRKASIEAQIAELQEQEAELPAWSKAWHAVRDRLAPLETELEVANEQLAKLPAVADSATQEPANVSSLPEPLFGLTPQQQKVQPLPTPPLPKPPEDLTQLVARRDALKQELRDHERSGTSVEDGANRMNVYRARRDKLMEQISRANMKIAMIERSASGTANGSAPPPVSALLAWPPDRVDMLTRLWGEGHTASEIGKALGGVSRNAVISKAQRLGLPRRGQD